MKILFVSEYYGEKGQGSYQLAHSHYKSLSQLFGASNIDVISIKQMNATAEENVLLLESNLTRTGRIRNILNGYPSFYDKKIEMRILQEIQTNNYDIIWFDNLCFGRTIKKIKRLRCFVDT